MLKILNNYSGMLAEYLGTTLIITIIAMLFALLIGLIFGLLNISKSKILNILGTIYVDGVRGVPLIVLAFFIYFGIPMAIQNIKFLGMPHFKFDAVAAGIIALSLNAGAYMAEIFRGGIQSIDKGQMEAARSLGLSYGKSMRRIVIPQAIRVMIPSFVNQFIISLKDTSILSVIGIKELTSAGNNIVQNTYDALGAWAIIGIIYMIVIISLSRLAKLLERRMRRGYQ